MFFAHADNGTVLVLRRRWELQDGRSPTGQELAARRISGSPLSALAIANLVSESASRSASRVVRIAAGRIAKTTITPVGTAWQSLPGSMVVRDLAAVQRAMEGLPPRLIRPRIEAEFVRVVEVSAVHSVGYDPGDQRLDAVIADSAGATATVSAVHRAGCPAALDALSDALTGRCGHPRFISGSLHRAHGALTIDPIAVMTSGGVIVPDLAPGDGSTALSGRSGTRRDPLRGALESGLTALAEVAHRGLRHLTPAVRAPGRRGRRGTGEGRAPDRRGIGLRVLGRPEGR